MGCEESAAWDQHNRLMDGLLQGSGSLTIPGTLCCNGVFILYVYVCGVLCTGVYVAMNRNPITWCL